MRSQDVCEEYVLIWFSVSGGIQLRSTSLWLEVPVSTFGAGRLLYKHKHRMSCLLFFLLMTPTQPHVAHALAKNSKEFKSVTNTCRSWCKKQTNNNKKNPLAKPSKGLFFPSTTHFFKNSFIWWYLHLSGLQQLVKAYNHKQPKTWQEDIHEDPGREREGGFMDKCRQRGREKSQIGCIYMHAYVSPSSPSSLSVMVTVWLNTASWKTFPCRWEKNGWEM